MELFKNYKRELKKLEELKTLDNSDKVNKIKILLQKDNLKIALFEDILPIFIETWNKYKNKPLGEQTRKKIQNEIEEKTNNFIFCYVCNDYYYCNERVSFQTKDKSGRYSGDTKIEIITNNSNFRLVDTNNKIQELNAENLREADAKTKTQNLTATANKIIKLHAHAEQLQEQLNEIYTEINTLSNHKINAVNYTNSVKHWII